MTDASSTPVAEGMRRYREPRWRGFLCSKVHGLREPIVMFESKLLAGRNRYRACLEAGMEDICGYQGDDPVAYVISLNLRRRHLDESQRQQPRATLKRLTA